MYQAQARELAAGDDPIVGDEEIRWAIAHGSPVVREVVRRMAVFRPWSQSAGRVPSPARRGPSPLTRANEQRRESTCRTVRTMIMHIRCRQEDRMRATRIMANLRVADVEATKSFYTDYLGLSTEEFNMGWVARYTSSDTRANVQLVTRDATAPEDSVISVLTDDVEGAYAEAQQLGYEIVHPLTTEPWGHRRFFVRAPDGNVINVGYHRG